MLCLNLCTSALTLPVLSAEMPSPQYLWQKKLHCEVLDAVLKTTKNLSVERWTLLTLNGCHLVYVVEEAGQPNL